MKIALLGDMAFFGRNSIGEGERVLGYYADIAEYLSGFDQVIGNLETPFCEGIAPKGQKSAYISASPKSVEILRFLNVTAVNLANNHMFDYGRAGYEQTTRALDAEDIRYVGVDDLELEISDSSARVMLQGYCSFNTNPLGVSRTPGVGLNVLNVGRVRERMRVHHENGLLNVVSVHSGQEHVNYPSLDDIKMARLFAQECPFVYYGHHPHVMQGWESVNDSLIAYSLGNFCFDDVYTDKSSEPLVRQTDNNKSGLIVELDVQGQELANFNVRTIFAGDDSLLLDPEGLGDRLALYSEGLSDETELYRSRREELISSFLGSRKAMRNLAWYLKRLNTVSVGIVLRAKYNQYQYGKNVSRFLKDTSAR